MLSGFIYKLIASLLPKRDYTDRDRAIGKRREIMIYIFFGAIVVLIVLAYLTMEK